ncbi:MAG: iron-sulfur cluster carrier protein ApbC [Nitrospiraceae bacterium]|nr:iron-sulfur cluster carrier protein ApbC [Nitrospiraceae bacterium]|tara:strand:+ start:276 stop:1385 length:1110 start_codon:yes stop_codon:yes gene_type:complete
MSDAICAVREEAVLHVLRTVQDPDLHKDIVSLGFIKNLAIAGTKVSFDVELTTPACPVKEQLKQECYDKVLALDGVAEVDISMTSNVRAREVQSSIAIPGVKNVLAVASGKGGVGKSTASVNIALALQATGARVGLLDADIYGPSIPTMLGIDGALEKTAENKLVPKEKFGLRVMSMGFLVSDDAPVVWRGPMVHGILQQFLGQVLWNDLDYLIVDMPPGTGDAQLTLTQSAPLAGAVIITTPQDVSLIDARRGLRMFEQVNVPVLGLIENMSFFVCHTCDERHDIFRHGGGKKVSEELRIPFLGEIPIDPSIVLGGDTGVPIVQQAPRSAAAKAYHSIASNIAAGLSMAAMELIDPADLKLQWKTTSQ